MRLSQFILVVLAVGVCIEKPAEAQSYAWLAPRIAGSQHGNNAKPP
jgi:hypothetical protein